MEVHDVSFYRNLDWDPSYLKDLFSQDFYDYPELWKSTNISDMDLVKEVETVEKYSPIVEDISLDDETLCTAVENIEEE